MVDAHVEDMVMKLNKWISASGIAGVVGLFSMAACSGASKGNNNDVAAGDGPTSTVRTALSGGDFSDNSVFIVGHRNGAADTKYPCVNDTSGCFNFGHVDAGVSNIPFPVPGDTGAAAFDHLCPTEDVLASDASVSDAGAPGTWTFTYHVWSQPNCTGTEITAPVTTSRASRHRTSSHKRTPT